MTCLVTGGTRGIGRATALLAARAGRPVAIVGRDEAEGREIVRQIEAESGRAAFVTADVTRPDEVARAFDDAASVLGPLRAVVNAAGVTYNSRVEDFDGEALGRLMTVNVVALMVCCREAVRRLSTRHGGQGGAIVNVSSMAATIGGRLGGSAYAASKAAVDTFTTGFAREVAREGIRVNTVRPGVVATPMTAFVTGDAALLKRVEDSIPLGRIGRPEEIAELIVWLLSDKASLVMGAHVDAGGGGFLVAG